jgi:hypothetical protein
LKSLKDKALFVYNKTTYRKVVEESSDELNFRGGKLIHVSADIDQTNMWIVDNETLPLIYKVSDNPLGIDWSVE